MLEKSINKNLKKHIVECRTIKGAYGPIIGLCDKNTWRNWAWVTDNIKAYNDIYDSKINIDNLTFAINQTKTPQPLGIWEVTDSNLIQFCADICPTSYPVDSITDEFDEHGECTNQKSVDIKYYCFNDFDFTTNDNSLTVAVTAASPLFSSSSSTSRPIKKHKKTPTLKMATTKRAKKNEDEVIDIAEETNDVTDGGMVSLFKHMNAANDKTYLELIKTMKEEKESNNAMLQMVMAQHQQQMNQMMTLLTNHISANGANANAPKKTNENSADDTSSKK